MKRTLFRLVPALALCLPALAFGQEKLYLTFAATTPTEAEAIGIFNPGTTTVDLSNYYVADTHTYYQVVSSTVPTASDFIAKFPAGSSIAPGEFQWISIGGAECFKEPLGKGTDAGVNANGCATGPGYLGFGFYPNYEFSNTTTTVNSASVPDMVEPFAGAITSTKGITNAGEPIVLFYWDTVSSLVVDVDYVYVGPTANPTSNPPVNKTGISTYKTEVGDGTDRRAPLPDGGTLLATCRKVPFSEGTQLMTGGNGVGGSDETSENTATTWEACRALPTGAGLPDGGVVEPPDAAAPGPDAETAGPDASEPGLDAAEPGLDATVVIPPDAAAPGLDAASPGLDAAEPGLDATVVIPPDAATPGLDATVVVPPDATVIQPGPDAEVPPGPDAEVVALDAAIQPTTDAEIVVGLDATTVQPGPDASEEEPPDAAFRKDAGKKPDVGTTETTATGCACGTTDGSGFASTSLFGMLALGLVVRRRRNA